MTTKAIYDLIHRSATELRRLHADLHEKFMHRSDGTEQNVAWREAADLFRARYDELAFPGGYNGAYARVLAGDALSMEAAVCFLELRPFFFRSGYMFKDLLRKARRAPLSDSQRSRLQVVELALIHWREQKRKANAV